MSSKAQRLVITTPLRLIDSHLLYKVVTQRLISISKNFKKLQNVLQKLYEIFTLFNDMMIAGKRNCLEPNLRVLENDVEVGDF